MKSNADVFKDGRVKCKTIVFYSTKEKSEDLAIQKLLKKLEYIRHRAVWSGEIYAFQTSRTGWMAKVPIIILPNGVNIPKST